MALKMSKGGMLAVVLFAALLVLVGFMAGFVRLPQQIGQVPQGPGAPVAVFDARISALSVTTITGSSNTIKPDGSSVTLFDTVAQFKTNNGWTVTITFAITNLNQGYNGASNTWQAVGKIVSVDQVASVASAYPYLINRSTTDTTQWDITYAGTDFASKSTIRDVHYFGDVYGKGSSYTAQVKGNGLVAADMTVGIPYCVHWSIAGAPLDECFLATA